MILGGGPNRIGQGIEFDYCCCHAAFALGRDGAGLRDDHGQLQPGDGVDRPGHLRPALFRAADRRGRARDRPARAGEGRAARRDRPARRADAAEARRGAAGGGRADPRHLARQHRPRRGPRAVRRAGRSSSASSSRPTASRAAATRRCGSPSGSAIRCCCGRPTCSAGAAWRWSTGRSSSTIISRPRSQVSGTSPVLIDRYLRDAIEVDVDAICDGTDVAVCGVLQHIEEAGVHSGDSACSIPPYSLAPRDRRARSSGRRASWRWRSRSRG